MSNLKPQSPLVYRGQGIYPLTSYDQIILPNGDRWSGDIGYVKRVELNVVASNWEQQSTGRYTQFIEIENVNAFTRANATIAMSYINEENYNDAMAAWSCVDKIETIDGGILLTCFKEVPTIDFGIIVDITAISTLIPEARGVNF